MLDRQDGILSPLDSAMTRIFKTVTGIVLMFWNIFAFAGEYPKATIAQEEGFVDISLSISKYEKLENGNKRILVRNLLNDQKISFILELSPNWIVKLIENTDSSFYWGSAEIFSVGAESDAFINQIKKLYGIHDAKKKFKKRIPAQVVGLANDPEKIEFMPVKMKFFFNSDAGESLYSEVFINIDLKNKILEFNEKDPEYRLPLVRSIVQ